MTRVYVKPQCQRVSSGCVTGQYVTTNTKTHRARHTGLDILSRDGHTGLLDANKDAFVLSSWKQE